MYEDWPETTKVLSTHLRNLRGQRLALRRLPGEQGEEAAAFAAGAFGLRQRAVEVGLLFGDRIFVMLDLIGARGIGAAAVDHGELPFEPHAHRIG